MQNNSRKTIFTTVSIDKETSGLVDKICKRYSLKKAEVVKLAFRYIDKANINPADTPNQSNPNFPKSTNGRMILYSSSGTTKKKNLIR